VSLQNKLKNFILKNYFFVFVLWGKPVLLQHDTVCQVEEIKD